MARLALNKSSLKKQRDQLKTYKKFLPSLDLKRQQLMIEWRSSQRELERLDSELSRIGERMPELLDLLGSAEVPLAGLLRVTGVEIKEINVVGVRVPELGKVSFVVADYSLLAKPFWVDHLVDGSKSLAELRLRREVQQRRTHVLADALRKVTQRVNLFEKVLIPQAQDNIRKINIFLADSQRVAVVRSKIAKAKTVARRADQQDDSLSAQAI
ncbi:V-type ATP synthase subunit D [bacterium]|nr:V-type ATP synthase subunit D [bacterium]